MQGNSSTSNFSWNDLEKMPVAKMPRAFLMALFCICFVELAVRANEPWFADLASWQWVAKTQLIDNGGLSGDIPLLGSSVSFHSLNPKEMNIGVETGPANLPPKTLSKNLLRQTIKTRSVVNLALNGLSLPHQVQMFERYLKKNPDPEMVLVELRTLDIEEEVWSRPPYLRHWASLAELWQSEFYKWQPSLVVSYFTNRIFRSFAYRESLDNWISSTVRSGRFISNYRDRNSQLSQEMRETLGFSQGVELPAISDRFLEEQKAREFKVSELGDLWLHRMIAAVRENNSRIFLFVPPVPPHVFAQRIKGQFYDDLAAYIDNVQQNYPELEIKTFSSNDFNLDEFVDDHHFTPEGAKHFTREFANWLRDISKSKKNNS